MFLFPDLNLEPHERHLGGQTWHDWPGQNPRQATGQNTAQRLLVRPGLVVKTAPEMEYLMRLWSKFEGAYRGPLAAWRLFFWLNNDHT